MTVEVTYHVPYNRFVAIFAESAKAHTVYETIIGHKVTGDCFR